MKKVGIIRCQQTEDVCPGTTDFLIVPMGELGFKPLAFASCISDGKSKKRLRKNWGRILCFLITSIDCIMLVLTSWINNLFTPWAF